MMDRRPSRFATPADQPLVRSNSAKLAPLSSPSSKVTSARPGPLVPSEKIAVIVPICLLRAAQLWVPSL